MYAYKEIGDPIWLMIQEDQQPKKCVLHRHSSELMSTFYAHIVPKSASGMTTCLFLNDSRSSCQYSTMRQTPKNKYMTAVVIRRRAMLPTILIIITNHAFSHFMAVAQETLEHCLWSCEGSSFIWRLIGSVSNGVFAGSFCVQQMRQFVLWQNSQLPLGRL